MAKTDTLHVRIKPETKLQAEETLNDLGLSITEAINIFLNQVILTSSIPFEIKKPNYNLETLRAIQETEKINKNDKSYNNIKEILKEIEKN